MAEVTVVANLPCIGMERGQTATVELTPMIQGALDGGKLSLAVSDHLTEILTGEDPGTEVTGQTTISEQLAGALGLDDVEAEIPSTAKQRKPRG